MYNFWDEVKKVVLGLIAIFFICIFGNWFINNVVVDKVESEIVYGHIYDITSNYNTATKVRDYKVRMEVDEQKIYIKSPRSRTREMYREKDKYINTEIELIKYYCYNNKGKLISIDYDLVE